MTIAAKDEQKLFQYCPRCGHTLYEDTTAEKRFGVQTVLCPVDRLRFTWVEATETLHVVKI